MNFVSQSLGRLLLIGLTLALGAGSASAQMKTRTVLVKVGETQILSMSKEQLIATAVNGDAKVCLVQKYTERAMLVKGLAPGASMVTLTDETGHKEVVEVTTIDPRVAQRKEFLEYASRAVPTASVGVDINSPITIVTIEALNDEDVKTLSDLARRMLGNDILISANSRSSRIPRVQQVELEVLVAIVNRSEIRNMSFNWVVNRQNYFVSSLLGTAGGLPLAATNAITTGITGASQAAAGAPNLNFGVIGDRGAFTGFLEALRTENLVKVLSEPRIVATSGRKANILSGGETPIIIPTGVGAPPSVEYKPFGTNVEFTPVVLENGKIQLDVRAELSQKGDPNPLNIAGLTAPEFVTRRAQSTVFVEDGQTLAIGGLIQNLVTATSSKVPVLGDIPFLGTAFSSTKYDEREEELIILVTPRLVAPMDCTQLPRRLPGRETRSPDDFELFLTQILEAPRGQREVCPDGRFKAAHRNGPTAGIYPCGDNSQSHNWNRGCATGRCATGNCGAGCASGRQGSSQPSVGQVNTGTVQVTEAVPVTTPTQVSIPEAPASLPIPEVQSLPPLSTNNPPVEVPLPVPGSLNPIGSSR